MINILCLDWSIFKLPSSSSLTVNIATKRIHFEPCLENDINWRDSSRLGWPYTHLNFQFPLWGTHFVNGKSLHDHMGNSPEQTGGGGGTPLNGLCRYVWPHSVCMVVILVINRVLILVILVSNRLWYSQSSWIFFWTSYFFIYLQDHQQKPLTNSLTLV